MKLMLALMLIAATPAFSNPFCTQLSALFQQSKNMALPAPFGTPAKCSTSLAQSGQTSINCAWPFAYRASDATQAFDALIDDVPACFETQQAAINDKDVNHPDFYDLRIFEVPEGEIGISLKDKGGLQKTYVFLRVTPASEP